MLYFNDNVQLKIYNQAQIKDNKREYLSIYKYSVNYTIEDI